jgi:hypothetical protein
LSYERFIEARIEARTASRREYHALRRWRSARRRGIMYPDILLAPVVLESLWVDAMKGVAREIGPALRAITEAAKTAKAA